MPTCSQAKIISNLEYDISKRVINLINREQESTTITRLDNTKKTQQRRNSNANLECQHCASNTIKKNPDYYKRRVSFQSRNNRKLPAIATTTNNNVFIARRESVPINFLYNSNYRNKSAETRQIRNSPRKNTNRNTPPYDQDDDVVVDDARPGSETNSSWCSSGSDNYVTRNSNNYCSDQENSHREPTQTLEFTKRSNSNIFSFLPKLALEMELIDDSLSDNASSNDEDNNYKSDKRRFSITGAKRLLALASIRPSKTFHKELTIEEAEILKKYYDIIKPKMHTNLNQLDGDIFQNSDKQKLSEIPILYNSAKINYDTFSCLEMFLTEYKSEITSGKYQIEYNSMGYNGFFLKNIETEAIIEFPPNVHDTFVALAISINSNGNPNLDENHILTSINWNDTRHILAPKKSRSKKSPKSNEGKNLNLPTVNLDAIKELSRMIRTVVEPKLLKKVVRDGMDVSHLPGGLNYDLPPSQEFEYTLNSIKKLNQQAMPEKTGKLKNVVYKKLKEKVSSTKVMWFSAPPVFKPLSVVFEYAGFDLTHETILEDVNNCLSSVKGQLEEIEFVPRSVHFGSVHVQNLWILTLNHKEARFYTISHGIEISGERVFPKSYDDYIFTEYEKYIRTEKYKVMIKNHERALHKQTRQ